MDKTLLTAMLALVKVNINHQCLTDYGSLQELFTQLSPRCNPGYDCIEAKADMFREAIHIVPRMIANGFYIQPNGKLAANKYDWNDWFNVSSIATTILFSAYSGNFDMRIQLFSS